MASAPLWRQAFDVAERAVAPPLESLVRTNQFARGAALAAKTQSFGRQQVNGLSARLWHLVNLPAGTDLARLRSQVGALDREVRRLTLRLEQERAENHEQRHSKESADAVAARPIDPKPAKRARPGAPRRRAQHPPSP